MIPDYFKNRKSIRKFLPKEVDSNLLHDILETAMRAPTTGNMQLYSVIVTRSEEMKSRLAPLHFSQPASVSAPVLITVCADLYRFTQWCKACNADVGFDNFLSFTSAFADAIIYTQQLVTIAEMQGLGTCYLGTVLYNAGKISELLDLPELTVPVATIALGWPNEDGVETERLPLDGVVFDERYPKLDENLVKELFRVKDKYPANQKFVEENSKDNLAQVFAEIRYPKDMNENISKQLLEFLEKQNIKLK